MDKDGKSRKSKQLHTVRRQPLRPLPIGYNTVHGQILRKSHFFLLRPNPIGRFFDAGSSMKLPDPVEYQFEPSTLFPFPPPFVAHSTVRAGKSRRRLPQTDQKRAVQWRLVAVDRQAPPFPRFFFTNSRPNRGTLPRTEDVHEVAS